MRAKATPRLASQKIRGLLRERKLLSFFCSGLPTNSVKVPKKDSTAARKKSKWFFASSVFVVRVSEVGNRTGLRVTALRQRRPQEQQVVHFEKTDFSSPLRWHSQWEWGALMITKRVSSLSLASSETRAVNPFEFLQSHSSSGKVRPCWSEAPPHTG